MSIDENENRPESAERVIQVTNCTIYVGSVGIIVDPRLNFDCTSITKTRATEDHDGSSVNTTPRQTDSVSVRSTKPRSQRQTITTPYAARPKATKVGPTSRQKLVCQRPTTSQLSCCLHGVGRCNYEARFGAGSDDCNAAARNGDPSRRNSSGRSMIWGTHNGGRLSPLRLGSRDQNVVKSDWPTPSKIPMPCLSQPKLPARQDRPVDLYAGSRLPVPVRPGPAAARIPRIDCTDDVRPPSQNEGRIGRGCATADKPHDTDDNLNGRQCVTADKLPDNTDDKPEDTDDKPEDTDDKPDDIDDKPDDKPDDTDDKPEDTDDKPDDTDDKPDDTDVEPHDVVDLLDYDDAAVYGQICVHIDELPARATSKQGCPLQALDEGRSGRWCATADKPHDTDDNLNGRQCVTADKLPDTDDKPDDTDDKLEDTDDKPDDTDDKPDDTDDKLEDTDDKPDDTDDKPADTDDKSEDKPDDTDVKPHDVVDLFDYDDTAVYGQPCVHIDELAASATSKQGCPLQALDDRGSTAGFQQVAVESDSLSDASDQPSLKPVDQNELGMTDPTLKSVIDDDDSHSSGHQSAIV